MSNICLAYLHTYPLLDPPVKEIRVVGIKIGLDDMRRFDSDITGYFISKTIQAELLQTASNQEDLYEFY